MYKGVCVSTVGVFVYRGFYFGLYDIAKNYISDDIKEFHPVKYRLTKFFYANLATSSAGLISYPIDTIRRSM